MKNQIIIYQPEVGLSSLEVRLENETVWLNRQQISVLFGRDVKTVGKHINNALKEELQGLPTVANFATVQNEGGREVERNIEYYNLEVITSVGYRVKSKKGVQFRVWANKVLKEYLLNGHAFQVRLEKMETEVGELKNKVNGITFQVKTELAPKEGLYFDGQIFDAYEKAVSFIKEARKSIILIDNYIDETVFLMLSKRKKSVKAVVYTDKLTKTLQLDLEKHNSQYEPVEIKIFKKSHDRFLIVDNKTVYHIGASLKDLGKKLFGFSKISIDPEIILDYLEK